MNLEYDKQIREQLVKHLKGGEAYMTIDAMLDKVDFKDIHIVPQGLPYSFFQLFYHIRFAQKDILDFSRNPDYESHEWPKEYWPEAVGPESKKDWDNLIEAYFEEREQLIEMLLNSSRDLLKPFPHGTGQNLLREALLIIEHTSYHAGQLLIVLRLNGGY